LVEAHRGLPTGHGRIGLAVYAKNRRIVYAVVQSIRGLAGWAFA
jgi:hypothetical protein